MLPSVTDFAFVQYAMQYMPYCYNMSESGDSYYLLRSFVNILFVDIA